MTSDLEERLTRALARAAEDAPLPAGDPVGAVRRRQRRRRRRRAGAAAACAVAVATAAVLTGTRLAAPAPPPEYVFSPDRIPDFADLPGPQRVWPDAVHRLPARLPDGSRYSVVAVLGGDRHLVTRNVQSGEAAPSVFDTRRGTVTVLDSPALTAGLAMSRILMAREVNGKAVWFLEGSRDNRIGREAWAAPLDGGPPIRLTDLPDGSAPRFAAAGDAVMWEQEAPGSHRSPEGPSVSIRSVPLTGGPAVDVPDTRDRQLADAEPWITDQRLDGGAAPKTSGELRNVVTGERVRWTAAADLQYVRCGPAWCTGGASGDRIGLQSPDGGGRVDLPVGGEWSPTGDGRLAVGHLRVPGGTAHVVWDRTTGRAATVSVQGESGSALSADGLIPSADFEPEVLTVAASDDELVVLDLRALG